MRSTVVTFLTVLFAFTSGPVQALPPLKQDVKASKLFKLVVRVEKRELPPCRTVDSISSRIAEGAEGAVGEVLERGQVWRGVGTNKLDEKAYLIERVEVLGWAKDSVRLDLTVSERPN
jgi:hypothetical protein